MNSSRVTSAPSKLCPKKTISLKFVVITVLSLIINPIFVKKGGMSAASQSGEGVTNKESSPRTFKGKKVREVECINI